MPSVRSSRPQRRFSVPRSTQNYSKFDINIPDTHAQGFELDHLDVVRPALFANTKPLRGLTAVVVGAGPAGLTFARFASQLGAKVTLLEQAGDPRGKDAGYTDRSFNITLLNVGRYTLADARAWRGGVRLVGRVVHNHKNSGRLKYGLYGEAPDLHLISIPRPLLRQNLVNLAEEQGAQLLFGRPVTTVDVNAGTATYLEPNGESKTRKADLLVLCDGLHSFANGIARSQPEETIMYTDQQDYFVGVVKPLAGRRYSRHHFHIWHESSKEAYALGMPAADGKLGLLIMSSFSDIGRNEHPFATPAAAKQRLSRDFTQLYKEFPELTEQLPTRWRGHFYYKRLPSYKLGERGVIIGDAGCAFPPNVGAGANTAFYGASSLVYQLAKAGGDIEKARTIYARQLGRLSELLHTFARQHSAFLSSETAADNPSDHADSAIFGGLIKQMKTELYG